MPAKFISHAVFGGWDFPTLSERIIRLWGRSKPLLRGLKPPLANAKLLLFSPGLSAPGSGRESLPCPFLRGMSESTPYTTPSLKKS